MIVNREEGMSDCCSTGCGDVGGTEIIRWLIFFFRAVDGIRVLVRSRGLRDVYKGQV